MKHDDPNRVKLRKAITEAVQEALYEDHLDEVETAQDVESAHQEASLFQPSSTVPEGMGIDHFIEK